MAIDIYQSRRGYNEICYFWSRLETDEHTSDELIMKRVPTGMFMAKESSPETIEDSIIGNTFIFDKTTVNIKTPDDCSKLKKKDVVSYQGEKWIVDSVQKAKTRLQQTEFCRDSNISHFWYISLRK